MGYEKKNVLSFVLFSIYLLALVWIILFKFHFSFSEMQAGRAVNLIPFHDSVKDNGLRLIEVAVNIVVFIPFGTYSHILKINRSFLSNVLLTLGASMVFEILQYIFAIGRTDITDLIGNTVGGMLGIVLYMLLYRIIKRRAVAVVNILFLIAIILAPLLIALYLHITGINIRL